jgi:hypothetical protein
MKQELTGSKIKETTPEVSIKNETGIDWKKERSIKVGVIFWCTTSWLY